MYTHFTFTLMAHCTSGAIRGSVSCSRRLRQGIELATFWLLNDFSTTVPLSPSCISCSKKLWSVISQELLALYVAVGLIAAIFLSTFEESQSFFLTCLLFYRRLVPWIERLNKLISQKTDQGDWNDFFGINISQFLIDAHSILTANYIWTAWLWSMVMVYRLGLGCLN